MLGLNAKVQHSSMLQVGLSEPYKIGQARQVTLRIFQRHVPMQCDGEPWRQAPATITVKRCEGYSQVRSHKNEL